MCLFTLCAGDDFSSTDTPSTKRTLILAEMSLIKDYPLIGHDTETVGDSMTMLLFTKKYSLAQK